MTAYSEFHAQLREVVRDALGRSGPGTGADRPSTAIDWSLLSASGWLGLEVPESLDGAGATFAEAAVVLGEMGRVAAPSSGYLATAVLGVGALNLVGGGEERADLLRRVAQGGAHLAVALDAGDVGDSPTAFSLGPSGARLRLDGEAAFVPGASGADVILALARQDGRPVVAAVASESAGLTVSDTDLTDPTRRVATVRADGVTLDPGSVWALSGNPEAGTWRIFDRAAAAIACDSLGLAEAMLEATVDYVRVREQFGRPIGSFQAVKHACADMLVQVEVSRELVAQATGALTDGGPESWVAVSQAKSYVCEAAVQVAGKAMQLHGGIGYTWESGLHFFMKRALFNRSWFGSPMWHRRRLAGRYI